jgi:hypothetical protein
MFGFCGMVGATLATVVTTSFGMYVQSTRESVFTLQEWQRDFQFTDSQNSSAGFS